MADNITLNTGSGGETLKTDDDGTAHWQYVKLAYGADNTQTRVTTAAPMPVDLRSDNLSGNLDVNLAASAATVTVDLGANNDVTIEGGAVLGTTGTAGPANAISFGGTESGGTFREVLVDSNGHLQVDVLTAPSTAVTNVGTFAVQEDGAALTALQLIDNSIFADDAAFTLASSSVNMAGAIRDDALSTLTAVEGDAVPLRVSSTGALHVTGGGGGTEYTEDDAAPANPIGGTILLERDDALGGLTPIEGDWTHPYVNANGAIWVKHDSDITIADGGNSITVDNGGTFAVQISDTSFAVADGNALGEGVLVQGDDGTDRKNINVDATTGDVQVDVTNTVTVSDDGSFTLAANSGVDIGDVDVLSLPASTNTIEVVGDVAHDAAAAGNPLAVGGRATNSVEGLTQVANADASYVTTDLNGCVVARNATTLEELISERVSDTGGTSTNFTTFNAGGVGIHNYITSVTVHNSHASTNGYVDLRDGSAGSVIWTFPAPATGGATHNFDPPLKGAANTALAYDVSAAISTVYISVNGFQAQG